MDDVKQSDAFKAWLGNLKDSTARAKIAARLRRLAMGNPGDVEPVGEGVSEMRIDYGPGYRVYYCKVGKQVLVVLGGGTKATQTKDIKKAKDAASEVKKQWPKKSN